MSEYQSCMTVAMKEFPKGISKEERGHLFCIQAKLCSGKATNEAEAEAKCNEPKPPKAVKIGKKGKGQSCEKDVNKLTECVVGKLIESKVYSDAALNINSVGNAIAINLMECMCPKI